MARSAKVQKTAGKQQGDATGDQDGRRPITLEHAVRFLDRFSPPATCCKPDQIAGSGGADAAGVSGQ
jgi:hypothetical protein